jgi:hypothetical protein
MDEISEGFEKVSGWNWGKILASATLALVAAGLATVASRQMPAGESAGEDTGTRAAGSAGPDNAARPRGSAVEDQTLETSMPPADVPFLNEDSPLRTGTSKRNQDTPDAEGSMGLP